MVVEIHNLCKNSSAFLPALSRDIVSGSGIPVPIRHGDGDSIFFSVGERGEVGVRGRDGIIRTKPAPLPFLLWTSLPKYMVFRDYNKA
ncbi:hypothetical protein DITRI_Ditri14bG0105800 [Diplodiscus trichospermus]